MRNVYTVGQVNAYIRGLVEDDARLSSITVAGEISNLKYHSSGHVYFTLKDAYGALSCVMWRSDAARLKIRLKDGSGVHAHGSVSVYEKSGSYQLYVKRIELQGAGALYEQVEELKKKLFAQGMFDEMYKKPLPKTVKTLGVVTAATGAAVRDIIKVTRGRNPYVQVILYPAQVQGEGAEKSIAKGIAALAALPVDVIIAGRGGGSIEDLMAFNTEIVARAIFDSPVPVVSGVGHETDTTIADFVADVRAATPSNAAEIAVPEAERIEERFVDMTQALIDAMQGKIESARSKRAQYLRQLQLLRPDARIKEMRLTLDHLTDKLFERMQRGIARRKETLKYLAAALDGVSPAKRLAAGYAYVQDDAGRHIKTASMLEERMALTIHFTDGAAKAQVTGTDLRNGETR
ncbi:MAG: exodeoxyribonuclease VII large subunit [Lachnospiraceae bacterium]|nr:exodeoxyribonuclease VII large subunit [Lachnospiraceae bacterium]